MVITLGFGPSNPGSTPGRSFNLSFENLELSIGKSQKLDIIRINI